MKNLTTVLFAFLLLNAYSQNDLRDGYIITLDDQKIDGLIDYRPNFINYKLCFFKTDSLAELKQYTPHQIKGYGLSDNSKYFACKTIDKDQKPDTCFLECLLSGKASVYYISKGKKDRFFIEKDSLFEEIYYDDKLFNEESNNTRFKYIPVKEDELDNRPTKSLPSNQYKKGSYEVLSKDDGSVINSAELKMNSKYMLGLTAGVGIEFVFAKKSKILYYRLSL